MAKTSTVASTTVPAATCILILSVIFLSFCGLCCILVDIIYTNILVGSATTSSSSIGSASSSIDVQALLGDVSMSPIWSKSSPFIVCEGSIGVSDIYAIDLRLLTLVSESTTSLMASSPASPTSGTSTSTTSTVPTKV